jgi:hypothetical protein
MKTKNTIAAALLFSITSGAAFAGNDVPDNVVGGDANGKNGYKTGVHINNAGAATGLADELVITKTDKGVTISADPYNRKNADATVVTELADTAYVDSQIANVKKVENITNNNTVEGDAAVLNGSLGAVNGGSTGTVNNTIEGSVNGSVNLTSCGSVSNDSKCNSTTTINNVEGDVTVNGSAVVVKGKDGVDGINGTNGKDGVNGKDGKDGSKVDVIFNNTTKLGTVAVTNPGSGSTALTNIVTTEYLEANKDKFVGKDGVDGTNGIDGKDGAAGKDGKDGKFADLTDAEKAALKGKDGTNGIDGTDGRDGTDGTNGVDGKDGKDGVNGTNGKSAFELAKDSGFKGSETEYLASLKGKDGTNGVDGINGKDGKDGVDGTNGTDGKDGKDGKDNILDINADSGVVSLDDGKTKVDLASQKELDAAAKAVQEAAAKDASAKATTAAMNSMNYTDRVVDHVVDNQKVTDAKQDAALSQLEKDTTAANAATNGRIDQVVDTQAKTDAVQNAVIDTKVDKDVFAADQARQDAALKAEQDARAAGDAALEAKKADKTDLVAAEQRAAADATAKADAAQKAATAASNTYTDVKVTEVVNNQSKVDAAQDKARVDGDKATLASANSYTDGKATVLQTNIDAVQKEAAANKVTASAGTEGGVKLSDKGGSNTIADNLAQVKDVKAAQAAASADATAKADAAQKAATAASNTYTDASVKQANTFTTFVKNESEKRDAELTNMIAAADKASKAHDAVQDKRHDAAEAKNAKQDAQLANHEGRIGSLEQGLNEVKDDVKNLKSGMAGVAAMATLVEPKYKGDTSIAVGIGAYQDATALAAGITHHWENGVSGKVAIAADPTNFSNSVVAGASVGYSW